MTASHAADRFVPSQAPVPPAVVLRPSRETLAGRHVTVAPLDPRRHGEDLFAAADAAPDALWDYLPYGPFHERAAYLAWLAANAASAEPVWVALEVDGTAVGLASWLNIVPLHRTIEIGHLWFSPALQKTRAATEAIFLMTAHAFELGYRRVEWKCNAANSGSRAAALRYGFVFEGIFRRHMIVKGCNRDTAWFATVEDDWPRVKAGFEAWLDDGNFDAGGRQKARLADLIAGSAP